MGDGSKFALGAVVGALVVLLRSPGAVYEHGPIQSGGCMQEEPPCARCGPSLFRMLCRTASRGGAQ